MTAEMPIRRRGLKRRRYDFDSSEDERSAIPSQYRLNSFFGRPNNWVEEPLSDYVYIDDYNAVEKVQLKFSPSVISERARKVFVHEEASEGRFKQIETRAHEIGMRVNVKKTQLLCVSGNTDTAVVPYLNSNRTKINSGKSLEVLRFTFGTKPGVNEHIFKLCGVSLLYLYIFFSLFLSF